MCTVLIFNNAVCGSMFIFSFVMLNVVHLTDVENISGCLGETMKDCGLTTKPIAALRPVGNSWIVEM